jgi:hypothetical protein
MKEIRTRVDSVGVSTFFVWGESQGVPDLMSKDTEVFPVIA